MKPEKLAMSAFGPYLERTEIDLSVFDGSGLYLVTGDTGAGKSTIFEAICYALYGETVSGGDRNAKMLRNKKAPDSIETYVELEFTSGGKRYFIKRSPKYELDEMKRTRKKAEEDEPAAPQKHKEHTNSFLLRCYDENIDYTREKDADEKIMDIVGMGKENFKKISMIAQGDFMSVIREKTEGRERILNSVFGTKKYGLLTEKLREYRTAAKSERDRLESEISTAVRLISCAPGSSCEEELDIRSRTGYLSAAELDRISLMLDEIIKEDIQAEKLCMEQSEENRKSSELLSKAFANAETREKNRRELERNKEELKRIREALPGYEARMKEAAEKNKEGEKLKTEAGLLREKLPEYERLTELEKKLLQIRQKAQRAGEGLESAEKEASKNTEMIKSLTEKLAQYEGIEEKRTEVELGLGRITEKGKQLRNLQNKYISLAQADDKCRVMQESYTRSRLEYDKARSEYERLNHAFLDDQAGILARSLEDGKPCPVCGSTEHPHPAEMTGNAPAKDQVDRAGKIADELAEKMRKASEASMTAVGVRDALCENISDLIYDLFGKNIEAGNVREMRSYSDEQIGELESKARKLQAARRQLDSAAREKKDHTAQLELCRKKSEELSERQTRLAAESAAAKEQAASNEKQLAEGRSRLQFASAREASARIAQLTSGAEAINAAYEKARDQYDANVTAEARIRSACELLEKQISENTAADLEQLSRQQRELSEERENINASVKAIAARMRGNENARKVIDRNREAYAAACAHLRSCEDLYNTASGGLPGRERLKLDSYVLSEYFDRILILANNRMIAMSDGRYQLVRSESYEDKRVNSGLELDIIDRDSGKQRRVSTLSGGESFMAALALSLGLSDEIRSSSGGIRLETMFIDEGFGSLDEKSLEKAVDALTALSTGECLIGIISHVGRLKEMISKRIVITRDNKGKTCASVEI